jgi:hypothetical protein
MYHRVTRKVERYGYSVKEQWDFELSKNKCEIVLQEFYQNDNGFYPSKNSCPEREIELEDVPSEVLEELSGDIEFVHEKISGKI